MPKILDRSGPENPVQKDASAVPVVLAVDLDGTVLRSDLLDESFLEVLSRDWRTAFTALIALSKGRAHLKRFLAEHTQLDITQLPYNTDVLAFIAARRAEGQRIALVTAADQTQAEAVAAHLGLFDEVHGSDGIHNLKGAAKTAFLVDHFSAQGFDYVGDTLADLPVWAEAQTSIVVSDNTTLLTNVKQNMSRWHHIPLGQNQGQALVKSLRPHQWIKNILIGLPILGAHSLDPLTLMQAALAFVIFSLMASAIYILNDLLDLSSDRAHPRKRHRPFASGAVSLRLGAALGLILLCLAISASTLLGAGFLSVMLLYAIMTTAYSLSLKQYPILDITTLAGLYTLRIIAGGIATNIPLSMWLLVFSVFFFFALAAVKRQTELLDLQNRGEVRAKGRGYHVDDLPLITQMALASGYISVLVMALYINSAQVAELYSQPMALWVVCPILLYWLSRMALITHRGQMHDDPIVFAIKDRTSQICCFGVTLAAIVGIWA